MLGVGLLAAKAGLPVDGRRAAPVGGVHAVVDQGRQGLGQQVQPPQGELAVTQGAAGRMPRRLQARGGADGRGAAHRRGARVAQAPSGSGGRGGRGGLAGSRRRKDSPYSRHSRSAQIRSWAVSMASGAPLTVGLLRRSGPCGPCIGAGGARPSVADRAGPRCGAATARAGRSAVPGVLDRGLGEARGRSWSGTADW